MKCPRDNTELVQAFLGGRQCFCCPECRGYFIDLCGSKVAGVDLTKLNPKVVAKAFCQSGETLISPASGVAMQYFEYKGIKLDYCESTHSIWMDHGEFERILRYSNQKIKKEESSIGSNILDVAEAAAGDGVIEFIGDAIGGLFDGF